MNSRWRQRWRKRYVWIINRFFSVALLGPAFMSTFQPSRARAKRGTAGARWDAGLFGSYAQTLPLRIVHKRRNMSESWYTIQREEYLRYSLKRGERSFVMPYCTHTNLSRRFTRAISDTSTARYAAIFINKRKWDT